MKSPFKCPVCNGHGTTQTSPDGSLSSSGYSLLVPCPACSGKGVLWAGNYEEEISKSNVSFIDAKRIFGKNYLIDCSRIKRFPENQDDIYLFFRELCRVLEVEIPIDTAIFKPSDFETTHGSCFSTNHSSEVSITARWSEQFRDFYLDVFSCSSFDEHLIRQVVIKFFEPEMYSDFAVVRRAPYGVGKNFFK